MRPEKDIAVKVTGGVVTLTGFVRSYLEKNAAATVRRELPSFENKVKVLVHHGWVTLEGEVEWYFQRDAIESPIRRIKGVIGVNNLIGIKPRVTPTEVKRRIEDAFKRSAAVDAAQISVAADGGEVTLRDKVRSWIERDEAQRTAWSAPGVSVVRNEISVGL
jgi:osmotically-inducible protein OsmY